MPEWIWEKRTLLCQGLRMIPFSLIVPRPRWVQRDVIELLHRNDCWKEERERVEGGWRRVVREASGQIAPSARLFLPPIPFLPPPLPTPNPPPLICPVSQISSHVTIGHLYNRGHPTFRLHAVFFGILASAESIIDECIVNGSKYFHP